MSCRLLATATLAVLIATAHVALAGSAYLYEQNGSGIGANQIWLDDTNCDFTVDEGGGSVFVDIDCSDGMLIEIRSPDGGPLQPGLFLETREFNYDNGHPYLNARGCYEEIGWFQIHEIHRDPATGNTDAIALDFESHCSGDSPGLQGQVRIGSTYPIDGSLEPFQLKLFGRSGDPIFQGTELWLHEGLGDLAYADATMNSVEFGFHGIDGSIWILDFAAPDGEYLTLGAYPGAFVQQSPAGECPRLLVQTDSLDCTGGEGWFQIDELWYDPQVGLLRFGATFEQYCGTATDLLHGQVRYTSLAPWTPPRFESILTTVSETGDPIGDGSAFVHRDEESVFETWYIPSAYRIEYRFLVYPMSGAGFSLHFSPPDGLQLVPGIYSGAVGPNQAANDQPALFVDRYNPSASCSSLTGEFRVHEVSYDIDGTITAIAIDFDQRCSGAAGELRGQLRYNSDLPTDVVLFENFERGLARHWSATVGQGPGCP